MSYTKNWEDKQKDMTRDEIAQTLGERDTVEYVFDPQTAQPKKHDMTERGLWFTCNDCPLRIFNKRYKPMQQ